MHAHSRPATHATEPVCVAAKPKSTGFMRACLDLTSCADRIVRRHPLRWRPTSSPAALAVEKLGRMSPWVWE
eukprot:3994904-Prymnesium_polylepis.1